MPAAFFPSQWNRGFVKTGTVQPFLRAPEIAVCHFFRLPRLKISLSVGATNAGAAHCARHSLTIRK
jgi:hypothetical protein